MMYPAALVRRFAWLSFVAPIAMSFPAYAADALELQGRGVQIYYCAASGDAFAWRLKAPEAILATMQGQNAGTHFAGPSWQGLDGSTVVGEPIASSPSPTGAIPWLILRAKSRDGTGVFAAVTHIIRTRTSGGLMPTVGCDREHSGAEARVDYDAVYTFFSK